MNIPDKPIIFLTFANDISDDKTNLRQLTKESDEIQKALEPLIQHGDYVVIHRQEVTVDDIFNTFQKYKNRIVIFHYGGHANSYQLLLNGKYGEQMQAAHSKGLLTFLKRQQGLKFVFFNGCSTAEHVFTLFEGGKSAIGTFESVNDEIARMVASRFYTGLAEHKGLYDAWQDAQNQLSTSKSEGNLRDLLFPNAKEPKEFNNIWFGNFQAYDRDWKLTHTAQKIEEQQLLTNPPLKQKIFLGREEELKAVHQQLFSGDTHQVMLINGEGGIGKTSLAAKYWHNYKTVYKTMAWLSVEDSLLDSLLSLAPKLGILLDDRLTQKEQLNLVLTGLAQKPTPFLLVLDNANKSVALDDAYEALVSYVDLHLLLTSRLSGYQNIPHRKVGTLDHELAINLFKQHYIYQGQAARCLLQEDEEELLSALLEAIGYNTLVIVLLAKSLATFNSPRTTHYALAELLEDLQSKGLLQLKDQKVQMAYQAKDLHLVEANPLDVIRGMYEVMGLSDGELKMLSVFSVMPAEAIPFGLLDIFYTNDKIETSLAQLSLKGWLEESKDGQSFKISPVIQEVIREKNKERMFADCDGLINGLIELLDYDGRALSYDYQIAAYGIRLAEHMVGIIGKEGISHDLAVLYERIGSFYQITGGLKHALKYFEEDMKLTKVLYSSYPEHVGFKNGLAISYEKLGDTHKSLGDLARALKYFEERSRLGEELYSSYPENVNFKNGLAISYSKLGETHSRLGDLDRTLKYFEEYSRLKEELYSNYPENIGFKRGLAISYEKLGATHSRLGALDRALKYFEDETELFEELYSSDPENVEFKKGLAISYGKLGGTYSRLGDLKRTLKYFEDTIELFEELYSSDPENVEFKNGLAISYEKLGSTHSSLGDLDRALKYFEDETELFEELYSSDPENVEFKKGLAISYSKLGDTHSCLGDLDRALKYFEEDMKLTKELYSSYPENVGFKNGLAISYAKLGVFYRDQFKQHLKSKTYFIQAKLLWEELHEQFPRYAQFEQYLNQVKTDLNHTEEQ